MSINERNNGIENLSYQQGMEKQKIIGLLSLQSKAVFQKFQELEQTQSEQNKVALRFARQQLSEEKEPTALFARPVGTEMYEWHTFFDIEKFLSDNIKGNALDIGSGGRNELQGILPDEQIVYLDSHSFKQKNFVQADARNLPFRNGTFDSIYASKVTSDYHTAKDLLPEMLRVIKPKGVIILRPNGVSREIMANLLVLKEMGVDIGKQCEFTLYERYREHKELPIKIDASEIFIIVRPK